MTRTYSNVLQYIQYDARRSALGRDTGGEPEMQLRGTHVYRYNVGEDNRAMCADKSTCILI